MTAPAKKPALKTHDVMELLRVRFDRQSGYAMLENVANGVGNGANGRRRFADALAMEQWGKSDHLLHGFEVKVSRTDWLKELKDETKADSVYRYCDKWWVVVGDAKLVKDGELPSGWGLLAPRGGGLVTLVEAARQKDVVVHDRAFVASIFRRAREQQVDERIIAKAASDARLSERAMQERMHASSTKHLTEQLEAMQARIKEFEEASGLVLGDRYGAGYHYGTTPTDIGKAVKLLLSGERDVERVRNQLSRMREQLKQVSWEIGTALGEHTTGAIE